MLSMINNRTSRHLIIFLSITIAETLLATGGWVHDRSFYSRFLGNFNPAFLVLALGAAAIPLYHFFDSHGFRRRKLSGRPRGFNGAVLAGACFGLLFIPVDLLFKMSPDINVLFPQSLLYYPVLGFIVDVLFHLIPVSLLYFLEGAVLPFPVKKDHRILMACLPCIFAEPVFQLGILTEGYSLFFKSLLFFFLTGYSICQLFLLVRRGFHFMLLFRYGHYFVWHILWGMIRLKVMF